MRLKRFAKFTFGIFAVLSAASASALACPMCKTTIASAENGAETASTINLAILWLLAPILALIGWLIKIVFTYRHYHNDEQRPANECMAPHADGD